MRLRNRSEPPSGGFFYDDPVLGLRIATDSTLDRLVDDVASLYRANGKPVPDYLFNLIEDQICSRQAPGVCYYTRGLGDRVSKVIHGVAGVVDRIFGTKLEKKARGCGNCSGRRTKLNSR